MIQTKYATLSKVGNRRNNEDVFLVKEYPESHRLFALVCDGMGGHALGEEASAVVADRVMAYWEEHRLEPDGREKAEAACRVASEALDSRAEELRQPEMGTTLVLASLVNEVLTVVHVGDSRCYVQRPTEGVIFQTRDHTKMVHGWEVLDRCFFSHASESALPDVTQIRLMPGDRVLLCSDGIYKSVADEILMERMMDDLPPERILGGYDAICHHWGDDNYTAVLIAVD